LYPRRMARQSPVEGEPQARAEVESDRQVEVAGQALAQAGARALAELWRPDPSRRLSILFDVFALEQRTRILLQAAMRGCGIRPDEYAAYTVVFEAGVGGRSASSGAGADGRSASSRAGADGRSASSRAGADGRSASSRAGADGRSASSRAGGITMTEVARQLGMPVTTAADYVRSMQARGHLRRYAHPGDGRAYVLRLTAAGLRAHREASVAFDHAYQALRGELGNLDEQRVRTNLRALAGSMERAVAAL
jgi:DNA-binding MarR family transcriptional regulator